MKFSWPWAFKSNDPEIKFVGDMKRLVLRDGDVLVVSCEGRISDEIAERIKAAFQEKFSGKQVLVLDGGMKVGVVGKSLTVNLAIDVAQGAASEPASALKRQSFGLDGGVLRRRQ